MYILVSVLIQLVIPAAFLIGLLYLVFESARKRRSPFLTLAAIVFFVAVTAVLVTLYATLRAHYLGHGEWTQERAFFFDLFIDELTKTGDLQKAAGNMQTPEVKERGLIRIQQIVDAYRPKTLFCVSAGGAILLLAAVSLWIKSLGGKVYFPSLLVFVVLTGGFLVNVGIYYRGYASQTDYLLKIHLRSQQEMMKKVAEMKTDLSIPEIVALARKEVGPSGHGWGFRFELELEKRIEDEKWRKKMSSPVPASK